MVRDKGKRLALYASDYVVFDLETTGLNPAVDEIIEISGIRVRNNQVVEEFSTLVNPGIPIPYSATRVNGITNGMVDGSPMLHKALGDFLDFAGTDILVGHNIHTFDTNFIYDGAIREFGKKVKNDYVDTFYMAKSCLPELSHYKLTDIAAFFHIETEGAHRALKDCVMNQQCYECLGAIWQKRQEELDRQKKEETPDAEQACPECGCLLVRRKGRYGEFWGCSGFPMCRYTRKG